MTETIEREVMEDKWLRFELVEKKPKTNVYFVYSKSDDSCLGAVRWYPAWRHYCFFPNDEFEIVFSDRCLETLSLFVKLLNEHHKELKKGDGE